MNSGKSQRTHLRIRTLVRNARAVALHHMGRGLVDVALNPPTLGVLHFLGYPSSGIPVCSWERLGIGDTQLQRALFDAWLAKFYPVARQLAETANPGLDPFFVFANGTLTLRHSTNPWRVRDNQTCLTCMGEGGHFIGCPLRANERPRAKRQ